MSAFSDLLMTAVKKFAASLAKDLLEGVAEIAGDLWRAISPEQLARIEKSAERVAWAIAQRAMAEDEASRSELEQVTESAVNTIRADLEAAGIVVRREAVKGVEKLAVKLVLGLVGV